jgi:hypothetical protein
MITELSRVNTAEHSKNVTPQHLVVTKNPMKTGTVSGRCLQ